VSVDTYLEGKNLASYEAVERDGLRLLIAPMLYAQARSIRVDAGSFLLWRSLRVEAEPWDDHFHTPACDH
jgi:hypothetical protein